MRLGGSSLFFLSGFNLEGLTFPAFVLDQSSIVLLVVWGIIIEVPHEILFYYRVRAGKDFAQMLGTFLLTLFVGVEVSSNHLGGSRVDDRTADALTSLAAFPRPAWSRLLRSV